MKKIRVVSEIRLMMAVLMVLSVIALVGCGDEASDLNGSVETNENDNITVNEISREVV